MAPHKPPKTNPARGPEEHATASVTVEVNAASPRPVIRVAISEAADLVYSDQPSADPLASRRTCLHLEPGDVIWVTPGPLMSIGYANVHIHHGEHAVDGFIPSYRYDDLLGRPHEIATTICHGRPLDTAVAGRRQSSSS